MNTTPDKHLLARQQAHLAVEWASRVARFLATPEQDGRHFALRRTAAGTLATVPFAAGAEAPDIHLELDIARLQFTLHRDHDGFDHRLSFYMEGMTYEQVGQKLQQALGILGLSPDRARLIQGLLPYGDEPPHSVYPQFIRDASTFTRRALRTELEVLTSWFHLAQRLIEPGRNEFVGAFATGPKLLCWPHHFDLAILHQLDGGRWVGLGLSPGDDTITSPYFYINLGPWPADTQLPEVPETLPGVYWHTEGFNSLVFPSSAITSEPYSNATKKTVSAYLQWGIPTALQLLGISPTENAT